jgi:5,10-methylenetetrahydromethanopterin reductase
LEAPSKCPKFGLAFQASQPLDHYVRCAKLAKKYAFDMVQVYDDLLFKPAFPVLFAMAPELRGSGIKLGAGVVNPYHMHPALIATYLGCLNQEMDGDSFIMIGRGAFHDLFDIATPRPMTAVQEAIEIVSGVLAGTSAKYDGQIFKVKSEARFRWQYVASKSPELWVGSFGPKMAKLAGKMKEVSGIMVSSITNGSYLAHIRELVRTGARSVSRNPEEIEIGCVPGTVVSRDRDRALELARKASAVYLPYLEPMTEYVGVAREEVEAVREALRRNDLEAAATRVPDKAVDSFKLWGTPEDIIEKAIKMLDSGRGADRINFGFGRGEEDIASLELLGKEVLPYLREKF